MYVIAKAQFKIILMIKINGFNDAVKVFRQTKRSSRIR